VKTGKSLRAIATFPHPNRNHNSVKECLCVKTGKSLRAIATFPALHFTSSVISATSFQCENR